MTTDGNSYAKIGRIISEKQPQILGRWWEHLVASLPDAVRKVGDEQAKEAASRVLQGFAQALSAGWDRDSGPFRELCSLMERLSAEFHGKDLGPGETASFVMGLREGLLAAARESYPEPAHRDPVTALVNRGVDQLGIATFEAYAATQEEAIREQQRALAESSVPVVKVWDRILMVPLIGILDSERTLMVMEALLGAIEETQSRVAILDISGIPAVDTLVARHLITTVSAVRLMGAECIVTGISAGIAQTMVQMGIDLGEVTTRNTLAAGLERAFSLLGLRVSAQGG